MECNEVTHIEKFCPQSLSAKKERRLAEEFQHRFCPDDKNVCKAECMSKQQYWNKKLPIISYQKLQTYNTSLRDLMEKSWKHYNLGLNNTYEPEVLIRDGKVVPGTINIPDIERLANKSRGIAAAHSSCTSCLLPQIIMLRKQIVHGRWANILHSVTASRIP